MQKLLSYIVHAPQFLITWAMFFGFGMTIYVIYIIKNDLKFGFKDLATHCVPFNVLAEKSFHTDVIIYIISKVSEGFILVPVVILNVFCLEKFNFLFHSLFPWFKTMPLTIFFAAVCTIVVFLVVEFSDFLSHYVQHKVSFLWELHKVHHSAQYLNPFTSKRGHPIAALFEGLVRGLLTSVPGGLFMFLFGISVVEAGSLSLIASKIFVLLTLDPLKHSHLPISLGVFDKVLISPHMHQIHHSKVQAHWDKNFGTNLSVFDWMAGTAYKPKRGEKPVFGISGLSNDTIMKYNSLYGSYVSPLIKSYKKIRKAIINLELGRRQES